MTKHGTDLRRLRLHALQLGPEFIVARVVGLQIVHRHRQGGHGRGEFMRGGGSLHAQREQMLVAQTDFTAAGQFDFALAQG